MFDWDEDYDSLVAPPQRPKAEMQEQACELPERSSATKWVFACGLLACVAFIGQNHLQKPEAMPEWMSASLLPVSFATLPTLPTGLVALEAQQAFQFTSDLRRFSGPELARYAETTRSDLAAAESYLRGYLADALTLIEAEKARRGL